jgi:hypothetical protein
MYCLGSRFIGTGKLKEQNKSREFRLSSLKSPKSLAFFYLTATKNIPSRGGRTADLLPPKASCRAVHDGLKF